MKITTALGTISAWLPIPAKTRTVFKQEQEQYSNTKKKEENTLITNKLASLEATLVRNSAQRLTYLLTGVKCRATSVAKNSNFLN